MTSGLLCFSPRYLAKLPISTSLGRMIDGEAFLFPAESPSIFGESLMCKIFFTTMVLALAFGGVARADEQAAATAILNEAITAHGGEAALAKFVGMFYKAKGTSGEGDIKVPLSYEWYFQGYDQMRTVSFDENNKIDEIEVVNGKEGWVKDGEQATENMSKELIDSRRELIYVNWVTMFVPLKAEGFRLSPLEETSVAGRKAVGILVSHDKHDAVKLYFDKETHLLVKYQRKYKSVEADKVVDEECVYSDYRDVQELKQPFKFETWWDGVKVSELSIVDMKLYEKPMDEKLFTKP
jgi:hypothetical protein